jgi:hypothetical protein
MSFMDYRLEWTAPAKDLLKRLTAENFRKFLVWIVESDFLLSDKHYNLYVGYQDKRTLQWLKGEIPYDDIPMPNGDVQRHAIRALTDPDPDYCAYKAVAAMEGVQTTAIAFAGYSPRTSLWIAERQLEVLKALVGSQEGAS